MYGLVSQANGDDKAVDSGETPRETEEKSDESVIVAARSRNRQRKAEAPLPDYLKPRPLWRRAGTIIASAIALIALIVLIVTDKGNNIPIDKWLGFGGGDPGRQSAAGSGGQSIAVRNGCAGRRRRQPLEDRSRREGRRSDFGRGLIDTKRRRQGDRRTRRDAAGPIDSANSIRGQEIGVARSSGCRSSHRRKSRRRRLQGRSRRGDRGGHRCPASRTRSPPRVVPSGREGQRGTSFFQAAPSRRTPRRRRRRFAWRRSRFFWVTIRLGTIGSFSSDRVSRCPIRSDSPDTVTLDPTAPKVKVPSPPGRWAPIGGRTNWSLLNRLTACWKLAMDCAKSGCWGDVGPSVGAARRFTLWHRIARGTGCDPQRRLQAAGDRLQTVGRHLEGGDEVSQLTFLRPETQCGLEILPAFPTRPGEDAKETSYRGGLYVVSGDVQFTESVGRQRKLTAGRCISLAPLDRAVATDLSGGAFRATGGSLLSWLNPESRRPPAALAKALRDYEAEFLPDQPVSASIGTVAKNERNPKIAELAVKTLALTISTRPLSKSWRKCLTRKRFTRPPTGWAVAPPGRQPRGPVAEGADDRLPAGPRTLGTEMDDRAIVMRLLWGYNSDDARDRKTSNQLVDWLDSDRLAMRLLAIDQIRELTGRP